MKAKYIIFDHKDFECPVIFSPMLEHSRIANGCKVLSAGFCQNIDGKWITSGKSVGLNIQSRPEDAKILNEMLLLEY